MLHFVHTAGTFETVDAFLLYVLFDRFLERLGYADVAQMVILRLRCAVSLRSLEVGGLEEHLLLIGYL